MRPIPDRFGLHRKPVSVIVSASACLLIAGCASLSPPGTPSVLPVPGATGGSTNQPTPLASARPTEDRFTQARLEMVEFTVEARNVRNVEVLQAMRTVPRHRFVPPDYLDQAYEDHPLPIGYGQTISQPYIVAWMTEELELQPGDKVLEIGTGSGYQAAVLAELENVEVFSIEIIPELAEQAADRLRALGYTGIYLKQGDGYYGWAEHAPFDAIVVTAAPDHVPHPLVEQLAEGGRLVIPIGPPGGYQSLWKFVRQGENLKAYNLGGVAFVPFTGQGVELTEPTSPP